MYPRYKNQTISIKKKELKILIQTTPNSVLITVYNARQKQASCREVLFSDIYKK